MTCQLQGKIWTHLSLKSTDSSCPLPPRRCCIQPFRSSNRWTSAPSKSTKIHEDLGFGSQGKQKKPFFSIVCISCVLRQELVKMSCEVFQVTWLETVSLQSLDSEPNLIIGHPQVNQNVFQDLQIRSTRETGDAGRLHGQTQKTHGSPVGACEVTLPSGPDKFERKVKAMLKTSMHLKNSAVKAWTNPAIANISPTIMSFHFHPPSPNSEEPTFFHVYPHFTDSLLLKRLSVFLRAAVNWPDTTPRNFPQLLIKFAASFFFFFFFIIAFHGPLAKTSKDVEEH